MAKCDYGKCTEEATAQGHVYGREKDTNEHRFYPVNACAKHVELDSFFWNESGYPRTEVSK